QTVSEDYTLEYGTASVEIHADACKAGERVLIVDDLIATGGTLIAAAKLFQILHGEVGGVAAIIDLPELGGSQRLRSAGLRVHTLCSFSESESSGDRVVKVTVWCNGKFPEEATRRLLEGTKHHRLVFSKAASASVLTAGAPDPELAAADVAFGQP